MPSWQKETIYGVFLALEVLIGAHGVKEAGSESQLPILNICFHTFLELGNGFEAEDY